MTYLSVLFYPPWVRGYRGVVPVRWILSQGLYRRIFGAGIVITMVGVFVLSTMLGTRRNIGL
jgi:hypothetical protein